MDLLSQRRSLVCVQLLFLSSFIGSAYAQDHSGPPSGLKPSAPLRPPAKQGISDAAPSDSTPSPFEELSLDSLDSRSEASDSSSTGSSDAASTISDLTASGDSTSSWKDNLRFTVDVANRSLFSGDSGEFANIAYLGMDVHKVFTADDGDIGTLILQPFLVRIDNQQSFTPSIFDDPHDWAIDWRISNFNYTGWGRGKPNIRVGSFELPFGLEQIVNTNGTIRDYTHFQNFGIKTDWGVTLNGEANDVEYEIAATRGSGNRYRRRDDPFLISGRVGTTRDKPVILGLSGLHGEIVNFNQDGGKTRRSRLGVDMTFGDELMVYMAEASAGFEDDAGVFSALIEIDKFNRDETVLLYNQFLVRGLEQTDSWDYEVSNAMGVRWTPDNHLSLSAEISHFFDVIGNGSDGTNIAIQARYRF